MREEPPGLPAEEWQGLGVSNGETEAWRRGMMESSVQSPLGQPWGLNGPISGQAEAVSTTNLIRNIHREVGDGGTKAVEEADYNF